MTKGNGKQGKAGKGEQAEAEAAQQAPRFFLVRDDAVYGVKCLFTSVEERAADLCANHGWRQVSAEEFAAAQVRMHTAARSVLAQRGA